MAAGSPVKCHLTSEALATIHEWVSGSLDHVVLKCVTNKETLVVESSGSAKVPLSEIAEDLPDTSPRFVLLRYSSPHDESTVASHYEVLLHFNPMDTLPSIKRSYELSKESLEQALTAVKNLKQVMICDVHDLTPVNMLVAIQGLKGVAAERLNAQFVTYGREKVSL